MTTDHIDPSETACKSALLARCRLKQAKKWFAIRGWEVLPQTERGWSVLRWGADQAWLAASGSPERSVRRWAHRWAPWQTKTELNELVAYTQGSNKRWSADQCAHALEISVADRAKFKLWHLGANDDPNYEQRARLKTEKSAARSRKYRAKNRTGAKRGRPGLKLSPEEKLARGNAQAAERMRRHRLRKNPSRSISNINPVTYFGVTHPTHHHTSGPFDRSAPSPKATARG